MSPVETLAPSPEAVQGLADRIAGEYHPDKVILFGSRAYGTPHADSDVDLLVILSFEGKTSRKSVEILDYLNVFFPLDIVVRRPEDVERRYREGDPLIREALDRGKVLYERNG